MLISEEVTTCTVGQTYFTQLLRYFSSSFTSAHHSPREAYIKYI
jgi:hypothetical protein